MNLDITAGWGFYLGGPNRGWVDPLIGEYFENLSDDQDIEDILFRLPSYDDPEYWNVRKHFQNHVCYQVAVAGYDENPHYMILHKESMIDLLGPVAVLPDVSFYGGTGMYNFSIKDDLLLSDFPEHVLGSGNWHLGVYV